MSIKELKIEIGALNYSEKAEMLQFLLRDFSNIWTVVDHLNDAPNGIYALQMSDILADKEFETLADQLANTLVQGTKGVIPTLSDYAVSRSGIYAEHA